MPVKGTAVLGMAIALYMRQADETKTEVSLSSGQQSRRMQK